MIEVHKAGLREYADKVEATWVEFTDEDLSELAQAAADALRKLADRVGPSDREDYWH